MAERLRAEVVQRVAEIYANLMPATPNGMTRNPITNVVKEMCAAPHVIRGLDSVERPPRPKGFI